MTTDFRNGNSQHRVRPFVWPSQGEPVESWADKGSESYLAPPNGRGADMMFTEDEPFPVRMEPAPMDFQAPLHTPYGTAERTYEDFWGTKNPLLERRNLLPDYAVTEYEWDRNPRECGKRASEMMAQPYEEVGSAGFQSGAELARTMGVKEASRTQYMRFTQTSNPTAYNADPIIGNSMGGGVPTLQPYLGKKGTSKPLFVQDYMPPAGGAMPYAPPVEPGMQLPSAQRSNRQYEEVGNVTGGDSVKACGDEDINPQRGGRPSLLATEYEFWGQRNGGFISSGNDMTVWNPNDGARYRLLPDRATAGDEMIVTGAPVASGPSLDLTPVAGGRESRLLNFERILGGASAIAQGSSLQQNPQDGGRMSMLVNFDAIGPAGALSGMGSSLQQNPSVGGRATRLINFDRISPGGLSSGIGSSLEHNPQVGGRASQLRNWQMFNVGGAQSGVSGLECNDVLGGLHLTRTEGCVGLIPSGKFLCPDYGGGDVAFGLEVQPRTPRTMVLSSLVAGGGGAGGGPKMPEQFISLPNTQLNGEGCFDDTPDPVLQIAARSTIGSKVLLDFSQKNIDDLSLVVPCI